MSGGIGGVVILEERLRIPAEACSFAGFRLWTTSDRFPEEARIDFLGGDIEVASEPGQGTRITIALPAVYEPPAEERPLQVEAVGNAKPLLRVAALKPAGHLASSTSMTQIGP